MTTYLEIIGRQYRAETHHAFLLYGNTRDLQIGQNGSCSLVEHMLAKFGAMQRIPVVYRIGIGWRFAVESDRATFLEAIGLGQSSGSDFAGLGETADPLPLDLGSAIGVIQEAMQQTKIRVAIIMDRMELIAPNSPYDRLSPSDKSTLSILQMIAADSSIAGSRNMIIGITDALPEISDSIRYASSRWYAIEILPPDHDERLAIARQVLPQLVESGCDVQMSSEEFAQSTSMMTRYGLMDLFFAARQDNVLTRDNLRQVKAQVMSQEYGDILETFDPIAGGFDSIAGMDELKKFFTRAVIDNMIAGNLADVPSGILFAGAAGLGKTYFMRGAAGAAGLPVISLNVGRLLGSYVGQSERNLERAITAIISAAPAIVVLDEIETTFPDRSTAAPAGDSGVSSRILKRMLEVLSDPALRGKICWIGITNFPAKLDAALSRAGRFDLVVPFLPPVENERVNLIRVYAGKYETLLPTPDTQQALARLTAGYTNAEIELVVRKARQMIGTRQEDENIDDLWIGAKERVRANTRDVESMTNAALAATNDSDLLHPDYIDRWRIVTGQVQPRQEAPGNGAADDSRGKRMF